MPRPLTQYKGDAGEFMIRHQYITMGYRCTKEKPNNEGFDFIASKKLSDGTREEIFIEVKAGTHGLSKAQKRMKEKIEKQGKVYKHIVIFVPQIYFGEIMRLLWPNGFRKPYFDVDV